MARFALRNQKKIADAFGEEKLRRLLSALKGYEKKYPKWTLNEIICDSQPYPIFEVEGLAVMYVTYLQYDVYHVALKEFLWCAYKKGAPSEIHEGTP